MPFRKKHPRPAPNKNQAKSNRRREEQDRPLLGALYPDVDRVKVALSFYNPQGIQVDENEIDWGPDAQVNFDVNCPGPCGDGRMDLSGKISETIRNRGASAEAKGKCVQTLYAGAPDMCGYELRCRIEVFYRG